MWWFGVAYAGTVSWAVVGGSLIAVVDGAALQGPPLSGLALVSTTDFDGDGQDDVLVSYSESGGGNCCPPSYAFAFVQGGRVVVSEIEVWSWAEPSVDGTVVRFTEENTVTAFALEGGVAVQQSQAARSQLATIVEVRGPGSAFTAGPPQELVFDLDQDGSPETIRCEVWERWGSLLCTLPLPSGGKQQLSGGCERLGVLGTQTGGMHDLVCNHETVLRFDGTQWK